MADAHDGMHIRNDEFDALVQDIAKSLDKFKVPAADRDEALRILNQMRARSSDIERPSQPHAWRHSAVILRSAITLPQVFDSRSM